MVDIRVLTTVEGKHVWPPPAFVQVGLRVRVDTEGAQEVLEGQLSDIVLVESKVEGEQVAIPPALVHELIVIVDPGNVSQVCSILFDIVIVLVVASQLPQVEGPPVPPPSTLLLAPPS